MGGGGGGEGYAVAAGRREAGLQIAKIEPRQAKGLSTRLGFVSAILGDPKNSPKNWDPTQIPKLLLTLGVFIIGCTQILLGTNLEKKSFCSFPQGKKGGKVAQVPPRQGCTGRPSGRGERGRPPPMMALCQGRVFGAKMENMV